MPNYRCACGQREIEYHDGDGVWHDLWAGYVKGHWEIHLVDNCQRQKLPMWRYRIFAPMMRFFQRLAGAHPAGEAAERFAKEYGERMRMKQKEARRASLRAALEAKADDLTQEK